MLINVHPISPEERLVRRIAEDLREGAVMIYPTDTVYAFGCDILQPRAIEKVCRLRGIDAKRARFSIVCYDLSDISTYAKVDNQAFKLMKKNLPGAFTFILPGSNNLPKLFKNRKTIGIRVPDNNIARAVVKELGRPILSASIKREDDEVLEYFTDPELIHERYASEVDFVVAGGAGGLFPSTVVDFSKSPAEIIRQGKGEILE